MKKNPDHKKIYLFLMPLFLLLIIAGAYYSYRQNKARPNQATNIPTGQNSTPTAVPLSTTAPQSSTKFFPPIDQFKRQITKKFFGAYITPQNSPVQPERFKGYHVGVDVEYKDVTADVPVYALADGKIVYSGWLSGYGGVFMIEFNLNDSPHTTLYGHIRPSSLPLKNKAVTKGEKLAVLGTGYTHETDGERRHLHFAILSNRRIDLLGYVQQKSQLSGWIDPLTLY